MAPLFSPLNASARMTDAASILGAQIQRLMSCHARHVEKISRDQGNRLKSLMNEAAAINKGLLDAAREMTLVGDAANYAVDSSQRALLASISLDRSRA